MQKGFSVPLLLVGVLITVLLFGWYFLNSLSKDKPSDNFSPKPADSIQKEGNLYTNSSLEFEFKYNNDLRVLEDSEEEFNKRGNGDFRKNFTYYITYPPAKVVGAVVVLDETKSFEMNPFTVWVFENPNDLTIEKWYTNFWYYPFVWGDYTERRNSVAPTNDATVSGQIAKSGVVSYQPGSPKFIYLNHNGKMYLIRVINKEGNLGDQSLEGFKFTN